MADGNASIKSQSQLVQAVIESGKYAFLIGAGTSKPKPADIPTGGGLVDIWQEECYEVANPDQDLDEWVEAEEETMGDNQSKYGFWFEKRHPTRGQRRERIEELVEDAEPTIGHIILAALMGEGYIPHVLTPNFDDLLFDAFYLYLEDKPNLVNHDAIAPEFKLTRERPAIVKLHGDYLYDNLQNVDRETQSLAPAMEDVLQKTVSEYGLIVIGYSGWDDSIMKPLVESDLSEYGLYWCMRSSDNLSPHIEDLLEKENTYLVEIDGFMDLMVNIGRKSGVELPNPVKLKNRAIKRAEMLAGALEEGEEQTSTELELRVTAMQELIHSATQAMQDGNYVEAISFWDDYLERESDHAFAYHQRGNMKARLGKYDEAKEDFNAALEADPEDKPALEARAELRIMDGEYDKAYQDAMKAQSLHRTTKHKAGDQLLGIIAKILKGDDFDEEEKEYRELCDKEFTTNRSLSYLDSWLSASNIDVEKLDKINELIGIYREHQKGN